MDQLIRGPLVWAAFGLFLAGLVFQSLRFLRLTRPAQKARLPGAIAAQAGKGKPGFSERLGARAALWVSRVRFSLFGEHPVMAVLTVIFHVLLFATPLLVLAHNQLLEGAIGVGLPSLPEAAADLLTLAVIFCGAVFLFRRLCVRRVRVISTSYDYLTWVVTFLPFLTGFAAYRHWFDYRTVITLHMLSGEVMLVFIPFTRLGHMLFFFLYRLLLGSEYSFGQGRRAW